MTTGLLLLAHSLLQSEITSFLLNITALVEGRQVTQLVEIKVTEVQGHGPRFSRDLFEVKVQEGQSPFSFVTSLVLVSGRYNGYNWIRIRIINQVIINLNKLIVLVDYVHYLLNKSKVMLFPCQLSFALWLLLLRAVLEVARPSAQVVTIINKYY